jgi:3-hydroxyacyl-[acyl-carrier-protein] dehydratase
VFRDHFPQDPVYPGVLLVEMMGQLALTLPALKAPAAAPPKVRFIRLHDARFPGAALPGDELKVLAELIDDNGYTFLACGQVLRGAEVLAAAVFEAIVIGEGEND